MDCWRTLFKSQCLCSSHPISSISPPVPVVLDPQQDISGFKKPNLTFFGHYLESNYRISGRILHKLNVNRCNLCRRTIKMILQHLSYCIISSWKTSSVNSGFNMQQSKATPSLQPQSSGVRIQTRRWDNITSAGATWHLHSLQPSVRELARVTTALHINPFPHTGYAS